MFAPKVLEEFDSRFSGHIAVKKDWNNLYVTTNELTQSGGLINDLWNDTFKKLKPKKNKTWLVLGLATGTVAKIIAKKYAPVKMTGVEIDSDMIRIGKKYFGLAEIPKLEIINSDARKLKIENYDYVLIDMYLGDRLPDFVYYQKFLAKVRQSGVVAVFNHLFYDDQKQKKAEELIKRLDKIYTKVQLVRVLTNVLIICS